MLHVVGSHPIQGVCVWDVDCASGSSPEDTIEMGRDIAYRVLLQVHAGLGSRAPLRALLGATGWRPSASLQALGLGDWRFPQTCTFGCGGTSETGHRADRCPIALLTRKTEDRLDPMDTPSPAHGTLTSSKT